MGFVVLKSSRNRVNLSFFGLVFSAVLWTISNYFADLQNVGSLFTIIVNRASFTSAALLVISFYIFTNFFPKKTVSLKILNFCVAILSIIVVPLTLTPFIIENVKLENWGWNVIPGSLYILFLIFFAVTVTASFGILYHKYRNLAGTYKMQIRYMIWGTMLTSLVASMTNLVLPLISGTNPFAKYGPYSLIFLLGFSTYAIVKHRLMDIRMVVARSVAYVILITIMAAFYAGTVIGVETIFFPGTQFNFTEGAIRTVLAVIMAFSFQPLRRWITKVTDKIFFKNQYDPEQLLDTLAHTMGSTIVLIELIYNTLNILLSQMKISRGIFVVLSETGTINNFQAMGYNKPVKIETEDMFKLAKNGVLLYDELEENSRYKHLLRKYDVSAVVPLKTEDSAEGLLLLGEKQSGDMFSQGDLQVLEIIAPELAVAITNAKAFEKIDRFNVTLRQEVKKATSELEKKNEQLRELDKAKDEFISMASHQLRTPLTAIKGYLSMLLEGDAGEIKVSQYDFVNEAFQGANRMVGLINDLLNVSRMETGRFFLEPVEVDLEKVIPEEIKQLENHAKEKKLYLKFVQKKKKIPHIWADETKIRQVIMNFIDNAVYYTTEGGVTVSLDSDKDNVIFNVTDTGIGVPKEQQKNLFTKFYRADNARHVRPDGTGLGIYLAKRVLDDHGGQLVFHSKEGEGSTFGFKFPLKSKLQVKKVSAPVPEGTTKPAIGELAAGIGVPAEALEATTQQKPAPEMKTNELDITKAAGIEAPLQDSPDAKDLAKEAEKQAESLQAVEDTKAKKG